MDRARATASIAALGLVLAAGSAQAQTTNWTGNTSSDWFTASNWSTGIPTDEHNVFVDAVSGRPNPVIQATGAVAKEASIGFATSATLTIQNGGQFNSRFSYLGEGEDGTGTATVTGAGSIWTNSGEIYVGDKGIGTLILQNGGTVSSDITIANQSSSSGTLSIGGAPGRAPAAPGTLTRRGGLEFGTGTGQIVFNHTATDYVFSRSITGTGSVFVENGTTILTGSNLYNLLTQVNGGKLLVNGSITSETIVRANGTIGGTGSIGTLIVNGGTYAPGNSIGTQTVNGGLFLNVGSTFEVEANADGDADKVIVSRGGITINPKAKLSVLAANGNYKPKTDYVIIENNGGAAVKGGFGSITTNLAFLKPTVIYNGGSGNDVVLSLIRSSAQFHDVANTRNEHGVADGLGDDFTQSAIHDALIVLTAEEAGDAFNALSGEIYATLPGVLANDSRYVREAVLGRLVQASYTNATGQIAALGAGGPEVASLNMGNALDEQAMALGYDGKHLSAPPPSPGAAFWTRAYGAWGDFEGDSAIYAADRDLGGFISGIDTGIGGSWRAGLAAGGAWSNLSVDDLRSSAEVESFNLAGYVGGLAGPLAVRGGGSWTWSEIDTDRAIVFPGFFERQSASYDADTGQIFGEVAYPIARGRFVFEPFGGLAYISIESDSFRENGDDFASLSGKSGDEDVGYSTLGLRAATVTKVSNMTVVPKVSAAWQHAFDDVTPDASLTFAVIGESFTVVGVPLAQDSFLLEAGLDFALSPTALLGVSYSGQFADDVTDNGVRGRLTWLF